MKPTVHLLTTVSLLILTSQIGHTAQDNWVARARYDVLVMQGDYCKEAKQFSHAENTTATQ